MPDRSPALATLVERGILHRSPDPGALDAVLREAPAAVALRLERPVLGLGDLVQVAALRRLQRAGHRPVILLGRGAAPVDGAVAAREARAAALLRRALRFGDGPADAVALDTARWRDGLRERASWASPDAALAEALDVVEVARRFGPVARVGALDDAADLEAGLREAARVGAGPVAGFTTVLASDSPLRLADGTRQSLALGGAPGTAAPARWRSTLADDVPRLLRLLTDHPLDAIQAWARGADGGLDAARAALAASLAQAFGEDAPAADAPGAALREVA